MRRGLEAKVAGAWLLHRMTADLDLFLLFSSAAGLVGAGGQANHVAANAYLDALAARRRAEGKTGMSLAWGAWSDIGSATATDLRYRLQASGMEVIQPDQDRKSALSGKSVSERVYLLRRRHIKKKTQ